MDTLPFEMIQVINDYLDFFDQVNFKNIGKIYRKINIRQIVPYIMISYKEDYESQHPKYFFTLDKFYLILPKLIPKEYSDEDSDAEYWSDKLIYIIYILLPNKPITNEMGLGNFFLRYDNDSFKIQTEFSKGEEFNYRKFITNCLDETNKTMLKDNII